MVKRPGSLLVLAVAGSALAGCARQPAGENVTKFAATVDALQDGMNDTLALVSRNEVDEAAYRGYASQAASESRRLPAAPRRPRTPADLARAALNPAFGALTRYAARLTDLSGAPTPAAADSIAARYPVEAAQAARAIGQRANRPLPESVIAAGTAAIQALASAAEGSGGDDVAAVATAMQPQVANLDMFITAVIGADDNSGLRLAASDADRRAAASLDADIASIVADRQETRADRTDRILARLHARDAEPSRGLLEALVTASDQIVAAHAALATPDSPDAEAAVERFQNAVEELSRRYERFRQS